MLILLKKLYGILYFDFTNQEKGWRTGSTKLEFKYLLSGNLNATYDVYALILHEKKKLSVDYTVIDEAKKKKTHQIKDCQGATFSKSERSVSLSVWLIASKLSLHIALVVRQGLLSHVPMSQGYYSA